MTVISPDERTTTEAMPKRSPRLTDFLRSALQSSFARDILLPFLASRFMLAAVGLLALHAFQGIPPGPDNWEIKPNGFKGPIVEHISAWSYPLLNMWVRWDASWYESIAKSGYEFNPGQQSNTAFFPLYPLTIRLVHALVRGHTDRSWFISGLLAANAQLLTALWLLVRLVRLDTDRATAARTALYYFAFSTTLFLTAPFSESTFLLVVVAAFYFARRANWMLAGIFGALAALARSPGILLCLPLAIEYLAQRDWQFRRIRADAVWLALIPAALAGLMLYFQARFGSLHTIRDSQAAWGNGWGILRGPISPFVAMLHRPMMGRDWVDLAFAWLTIGMAIYAGFTLRLSYGVYAVASALFLTSWGSYESMPRYILPVFPIFIAFAKWGRNERFDRAFLIINSGLAALFMIEFALWRWVA